MEKLSANERKSIWNNFCAAFEDYIPPRHGYDYEMSNVIKSKLRCAYSVILLKKYGLLDDSALSLSVPSLELISKFHSYPSHISEDEEWIEYMNDPDIIWELSTLNTEILYALLKKTGWRMYIAYDLEGYQGIPRWVINSCSSNIELHMGAAIGCDPGRTIPKCLRHLNPDDTMSDFFLFGNLIIWNSKIEKAMKLKGTYPEKEEIFHYLNHYLLDRYYPFSTTDFPRNDNSICFSYILGDYYGSDYGIEGVELYGLNYESVVGYLFADMAAEELLRQRATKNKGETKCNLQIA